MYRKISRSCTSAWMALIYPRRRRVRYWSSRIVIFALLCVWCMAIFYGVYPNPNHKLQDFEINQQQEPPLQQQQPQHLKHPQKHQRDLNKHQPQQQHQNRHHHPQQQKQPPLRHQQPGPKRLPKSNRHKSPQTPADSFNLKNKFMRLIKENAKQNVDQSHLRNQLSTKKSYDASDIKPGKQKHDVSHSTNKTNGLPGVKEYVEFDWWKTSASGVKPKRAAIVPGGRRDPHGLGEFGRPVHIEPNSLNRFERIQYEKGLNNHKFNDYASQKISVQREVFDHRSPECKKEYDNMDSKAFPKASIIVCFFNEAWSVLQRTVYSVLLRSPPHLIEEIILIDDFSDHDELKEPLKQFVRETDKVRLLRMTNRSGLVRARLAGIQASRGPVLLFLDSHVECQKGWLEPLLRAIVQNPGVAVTPMIDVIDDKTFSITPAGGNIGILDFDTFSFNWGPILPRMKLNVKSPADPLQSPTMAGGLFAIKKDFFLQLGTYDPHLAVWGGENIELSLKLWLCGEGILTHPCSRVSHIFRDTSPYLTGKSVNVALRNAARVAFVWADQYKRFYFRDKPFTDDDMKAIKKDIKERIDLRKKLQCKPFRWFVDHIYPELYIDGSGRYLGPIEATNGLCLDEDEQDTNEGKRQLFLVDCSQGIPVEMSRTNQIRLQKQCMTVMQNMAFMAECRVDDKQQVFEYVTKARAIYHPKSSRCLTVGPPDGRGVYWMPCVETSPLQEWLWPLNPDYVP